MSNLVSIQSSYRFFVAVIVCKFSILFIHVNVFGFWFFFLTGEEPLCGTHNKTSIIIIVIIIIIIIYYYYYY